MFIELLFVACGLNIIAFSEAASASFITKCKSDDSKCITANAVNAIPLFAAGIPELGVEILDPSQFEVVDASKDNLLFFLRNVLITGLKNCKALNIRREPSKSKLYLELDCPIELRGQYELSGKVLTINLQGNGPIYAKIRFVLNFNVDVEEKAGADGKMYLNIKKFDYTYDLLGKSDLVFENLFPDNEVLRKAAMEVIKLSGNEIVMEIGDPMVRTTATKCMKNINNFFKIMPIEELSLD